MTVDIGYVVNQGWSHTQRDYNETHDDEFAIRVQVEMSDSTMAAHNTWHQVHLAVRIGDFTVVGEKRIWYLVHKFSNAILFSAL